MRYGLLICALALAGCVTSSDLYTQDGAKGHVIACPSSGGIVGKMTNWGTCYQRAGEICGTRGYVVLAKSDEPGFAAAVGQYGGSASTTSNRSMVIQCKDGVAGQVKQ